MILLVLFPYFPAICCLCDVYAPTGTGDFSQRGAIRFPQTETEVGDKDIRNFPFSINSSSYIRRVLAAIELQEK